ncbi:MAG: iron-containing alcohol dehydrogenase [Clostridiaceae bacterium]|nr:iron-containing alcohol dehydrogenase [Clostridiaceae bacterium]NBI81724.1 iron-containing alcohol dehydrogenase [Clostridiaceae bacterium]
MLDFTFTAPTRFVFGKASEQQAGTLCRAAGARKVLVVTGGGSARRSGLLDRVTGSLDGAGLPWLVLEGIRANPTDGPVYEGIRLARAEGADFLLAVGGGSVIDTAKAIALGAVRDGDFWDCYSGAAACTGALPVGVVLTIPASGSEGCGSSVITKGGLKRSATADALIPKFSILNPELTNTLPAYQTACGCVDMLSHCCERYFTKTPDADLTGRLGEAIMACIVKYAPIALAEPENYEARANLMWCGTLAHNNLTASGRQPDFACHRMEHELSALYDVAHGAGLAVVTPAWMKYVYQEDPLLFAHWGHVLFGLEIDCRDPARTARQAIARLEGFYRSLGMPARFADIGARAEDIPLLAKQCQRNNGAYCGFFRPLAEEDLVKIYEMML